MDNVFSDFLFVKRKGVYQKIAICEILLLEANGDYVIGHLMDQEKFVIRTTLSKMEELLPTNNFMRIHRSYIIQFQHITAINFQDNNLYVGELSVPINRASRKIIADLITKLE
jgi:DNA-binding LytR/AlgR family response regulator